MRRSRDGHLAPAAYKWWSRWREEGLDGLVDRSSRPHSCAAPDPPALEEQIAELRPDPEGGPGPDRSDARGSGLDGAPGLVSPRAQPALLNGPADGAGDPALRTRRAWRARACRHQEARPGS
ncbi:leucine zipper domain-containing protein [Aquihabitans sp. G128]|uniref:leucine zipper domain-containing protein n=1 Tax=Aquihabitans sp. G128 TaxID=2849779 RepID=UPI00352E1520